jgi:peptidoglycan/xylan/chitin deacetylase (PgdA/CDA1 family)
MAQDLIALLKSRPKREEAANAGHKLLWFEYDLKDKAIQTEALYRKVLLEKNISVFHELPVLMYHRVVEKDLPFSKYNIYVTRENLEKQFQFLQARGFETITFGDLMTRRIPRKPILLTFDDGYEDNYHHLFPLLKRYNVKAVIYILGNRNHKTNYWDAPQGEPKAALLKDKQIREMARTGLVEFGSHGMNHVKLTDLKSVEIQNEVTGSRKVLEKLLGKPIVSFAYPYGEANGEVKHAVREAGYTFGVSVQKGPTRFAEDLMEIRRVHMFPHTSLFDFWKKTSGYYLRYRALFGK